jgi:hypothetical protein
MATVIRKTEPSVSVWAPAFNALARLSVGSNFHYDASETTVTAATASDLPTSLALVNNLIGVARFHVADTVAHKAADATSLPAIGAAVDLASAITAANAIKAWYNTHRASTTYHATADATNATTSADATDQTSLNTLANELKTDMNAHMASAIAVASFRVVDA